jgi:FkbM family methyltransferase
MRWPRRLGKFLLFVSRGLAPATAWWLARHDATKCNDYRGVPLSDLAGAWEATGRWNGLVAAGGTIRSTRVELPFHGTDLLARGFSTLAALHENGFAIARAEGGTLLVTNATWHLRVTTEEEISMLHEIFLDGCYDLRLSGHWNVLDIGANVGLAGLFFAAQPWVHQVIAFEPFAPTGDAHRDMLALNPGLAAKISLHRYGLGETTERLTVGFCRNLCGSMSIHGLGSWRGAATTPLERVDIEVRRASEVLDEFAPTLAGRRTLAKIDCEGSEYPILRDLERSGWLTRLDAIIMEWHGRQPDELVERLQRAGFGLHVRNLAGNRTLGLILAWRDRAG